MRCHKVSQTYITKLSQTFRVCNRTLSGDRWRPLSQTWFSVTKLLTNIFLFCEHCDSISYRLVTEITSVTNFSDKIEIDTEKNPSTHGQKPYFSRKTPCFIRIFVLFSLILQAFKYLIHSSFTNSYIRVTICSLP